MSTSWEEIFFISEGMLKVKFVSTSVASLLFIFVKIYLGGKKICIVRQE